MQIGSSGLGAHWKCAKRGILFDITNAKENVCCLLASESKYILGREALEPQDDKISPVKPEFDLHMLKLVKGFLSCNCEFWRA
uniref:Uncharacterized protein n=1 Tax=Romanomermis culicivorax TaxID=13658 RepID=A0A915JVQ2_ROMCU